MHCTITRRWISRPRSFAEGLPATMGAALYKLPREAPALFVRKRATQRVVLRQGGARRSG